MQWEYHIEAMPTEGLTAILERLRALGLDGWEMCAQYPREPFLLFKRRKL